MSEIKPTFFQNYMKSEQMRIQEEKELKERVRDLEEIARLALEAIEDGPSTYLGCIAKDKLRAILGETK